MRIEVQRGRRTAVTQPVGDVDDRHILLDQVTRRAVPQVVQAHHRQIAVFQNIVEASCQIIRLYHLAVRPSANIVAFVIVATHHP